MSVIGLAHADPIPMIGALRALLSPRQLAAIRLAAGPDGRSLVVSGDAWDIEIVRAGIAALDRPRTVGRQVRVLRLTTAEPAAALQRARELYELEVERDDPSTVVLTELLEDAGLLTVVGAPPALDRFAALLTMVEQHAIVERETRQLPVLNAEPSTVVAPLATMARQLLEPRDGSSFAPPTIEAIDQLDLLLVTAAPDQFATVELLLEALDRRDPSDYRFRVVPLTGVEDVSGLLERADRAFALMNQGLDGGAAGDESTPAPNLELDRQSGTLVISGLVESVQRYEEALGQARGLMPPPRRGRLIPLERARASAVVEPLRELLQQTAPPDGARQVPPPEIEVIEPTNSLYVVAEDAQFQFVEALLRQLDETDGTALPSLRVLEIRSGDAAQLARVLRERYDARPAAARQAQPVEIAADPASSTLFVAAEETIFEEIASVVDEMNRLAEPALSGATMVFPLARASATDLAPLLDRMYPQPPAPVDGAGNPQPHLQEPKPVRVSADGSANALIVVAPPERRQELEQLIAQLDQVKLAPRAALRTYHLQRGDPAAIASTLQALARQGILSEPPKAGEAPLQVLVQVDPGSRSLIVAGDAVTFEKTEALLADLETAPAPRRVQVFPLSGVNLGAFSAQALELYRAENGDDPAAPDIDVQIDPGNAALVAVADEHALARFASIVQALASSQPPPPDVRLIALQHAEAEDVVTLLEALLARQPLAGPPPVLEAIDRTRSILVSASPRQQETIVSLVRGLDVPPEQTMPPLRVLPLRSADASRLAEALAGQYERRSAAERAAAPVTITADPQSNALLVSADPALLPQIEAVVDELNRTDRLDAEDRQVRTIPLRVARAENVAPIVQELLAGEEMPIWIRYDALARNRPLPDTGPDVRVAADSRLNAVIVSGPRSVLELAESMVQQLDVEPARIEGEAARMVRVLVIENADAAQLAQSLGSIFSESESGQVPPTIRVDGASNSLIVRATPAQFQTLDEVVQQIDAATVSARRQIQMIPIDPSRASAEEVARTLQRMLDRGGPAKIEVIDLDELLRRQRPRPLSSRPP